jgi:hypothetical protein
METENEASSQERVHRQDPKEAEMLEAKAKTEMKGMK